jgi:hypothetical protein
MRMYQSGKKGGKWSRTGIRGPFSRLLPWIALALGLAGCAHNHPRPDDTSARLKAERIRKRKIEALSRENSVLAEEKGLLEKDVSRLREELERTRRDRERERGRSDSALGAMDEKVESLDDSLDEVRGGFQDSLDGLRERRQSELDSLRRAYALSEDSLQRGIKDAERECERRGRDLGRLEAQYEKDRYAWERMKEELFRRLETQAGRMPLAQGPLPMTGNVADTLPRP